MEKLIANKGKYRIVEIGGILSTTLHLQVKKWYGYINISSITVERDSLYFQRDYHYYIREFHDILLKLEEI